MAPRPVTIAEMAGISTDSVNRDKVDSVREALREDNGDNKDATSTHVGLLRVRTVPRAVKAPRVTQGCLGVIILKCAVGHARDWQDR